MEKEITGGMLESFYRLTKQKKEIERELNELKNRFHTYFDGEFGQAQKGELKIGGWTVQRQVRKLERYNEKTVPLLEELGLGELIETVKKPNADKIAAAIELGLLKEEDIAGCRISTFTPALTVKEN